MSFEPTLLHQDQHVLVFDKPAGLAVQGGSAVTQSLEDLIADYAKSNGRKPRLVHRLDRETSGVLVVARTQPAAAFLSAAFAERRVEKTYLAIVCGGAPEPAEGRIEVPLVKETRRRLDLVRPARPAETPALAAQTLYRTLAAGPTAALLELSPLSGRMHQLRVHLASVGRPIAGDGKYGGLFSLGPVAIPGLMLHAMRLRTPHPAGGALDALAPPPPAFLRALDTLPLPFLAPKAAVVRCMRA